MIPINMINTPMRQYDPDKYDNTRALMLNNHPDESVILRFFYDISADNMRYCFASEVFYAHEGRAMLASSIAWERYDKHGNLIDHFETPAFWEQLRRKAYQQEAAAQQASLGCIPKGTKGTVTEAVFKAGSLADYYFAQPQLTLAEMRAAGINVQKEPAPELWWQTEQRLAAVKRDELVAMRADVRRMLMGG